MCRSWDKFVGEESIARIIGEFVNHFDIEKYDAKSVALKGCSFYDLKG